MNDPVLLDLWPLVDYREVCTSQDTERLDALETGPCWLRSGEQR